MLLSLLALALAASASPLARHRHHLHPRNHDGVKIETVVVYVTETARPSHTPAPAPEAAAAALSSSAVYSSRAAPQASGTTPPAAHTPHPSSAATSPVGSSDPVVSALAQALLGLFAPPATPFPDNSIPCSSFPGDQPGVLNLAWLNLGGWAGLQNPGGLNPSACSEGVYCSYACQAGMLKTQWPASQPANGASVGGLLCKNGVLTLTSPDRSPYLCEWGTDTVYVVNNLSQQVVFCATDYPGTENMVRPVSIAPGETQPLSVPDQSSYFKWNGKPTSTQYYVNSAGIAITEGCVWGSSSQNLGNWAPLNVGAGTSDGITYVSLIANPLTSSKINFNAQIVAAPGSTVNGACSISNGQFGGNTNGNSGCTASLTAGKAHIVLSN
ncbi:putative secreted beta-glucosidase SUN4 [Neolecta irregularis DAH-3]|uniref:Putative secreted beta-glucosidase SUN4 n=1 Tax=Neolecta irregularis (strain DAH-3) TaxID=1198029 RepID=A0A1U7LVF2_NEOID|nr:putative secreted beta-glucosidase SUN4 [Neolecta irregularis DAH-3]|eukprot:OLL26655.1 putative secreted beta-glucosidase SUN4 [Neolecta irregularis DAH-3]